VRRTEAPERVVSDLAELTPPFDLLTLWDVLEHSTEPVELLRSLKSLVRVNGRILVSSPDFVAMKLRWHLLRRDPQKFHDVIRPDEHAIQFTRAGLRRTLETAGWSRVSFVRPPLSRPRPAVVDGLLRRVPGLRHGLFAVAISA
jgi:hypothetical protein